MGRVQRRGGPTHWKAAPCYAGLDLSSTSDLTALMLVFPATSEDEAVHIALPFFGCPRAALPAEVRRDHVPPDQ